MQEKCQLFLASVPKYRLSVYTSRYDKLTSKGILKIAEGHEQKGSRTMALNYGGPD